jgi:hypothetical protein
MRNGKFRLVFKIDTGKFAKILGAVAPRVYLNFSAHAVRVNDLAYLKKFFLFCHSEISFT